MKVYLHVPGAPDKLLGRVETDGRIYRSQAGPDEEIGHVDLATGNVYEQRFGPDKKVGHGDLSSGKVYVTRFGPDEHVGEVKADGTMRHHAALAADDYVARVDQFLSYAHSTGAMLLLVLPELEPPPDEDVDRSADDPETEEAAP
jgi:hypothetical protein